jgi:hypothetical protein
MARKAKSESKKTGLYHAREARRMSRSRNANRDLEKCPTIFRFSKKYLFSILEAK